MSMTLSDFPRKVKRDAVICGHPLGGGILSSQGSKCKRVVKKV